MYELCIFCFDAAVLLALLEDLYHSIQNQLRFEHIENNEIKNFVIVGFKIKPEVLAFSAVSTDPPGVRGMRGGRPRDVCNFVMKSFNLRISLFKYGTLPCREERVLLL